MPPENQLEPFLDNIVKLNLDTKMSEAVKTLVTTCKGKYTRVMDNYCHWLDEKWISPNQVVTWRVVAWVAVWAGLASWDYWPLVESAWVGILWISLIHDAVDGHLARLTQQTSKNWETLDALWDKIKVYILLAILLATIDVAPTLLIPLVWLAGISLVMDIKSQLMRNNNIDALNASWQDPLSMEERKNNPNEKSSGAAVVAWKAKTWVIMTWITLWFMKDIPWFELSDENAIPLLVSLVVSNILSGVSLKQKKKKQLQSPIVS